MTYKDQFVVEVKCKGKILRTIDDFVSLPFGSEYSLYFKNLSSKRASINISIDGQDVLDGHLLILNGNRSTELQGFMRGNQVRNRFKFIQKTKEIQEHRGDKIDDGFIRVEFAYEKPTPEIIRKTIIHEDHYYSPFKWNYGDWFTGDSNVRYTSCDNVGASRGISSGNVHDGSPMAQTFYSSNVTMDSLAIQNQSQPLNDEGITVKGSEMLEQYDYTTIGELEESKVIIIRLRGATESQKPIQQPITVSTRYTCSSCGMSCKSSFKYCPRCGTYLE